MAGRRTRAKKPENQDTADAPETRTDDVAEAPRNEAAEALAAGAVKRRGRGRPRKTENAEMAQSDEALQSQLREILALKKDKDEKATAHSGANARYRSAIKVAKKIGAGLGLTTEDIVWSVQAIEREPDEIDAETRRRNKLAQLMALPIGTQLGMFEDGTSVATRVEDAKMATGDPTMEGTEQEARIGGRKSYDLGMEEKDNPYPADDARHAAWNEGRDERKGEVAQAAGEALSRPHATPGTNGHGTHA